MWTTKIKFLLVAQTLWRFIAWAVVPFLLIFAKKINAPGYQKYTLPKRLQWAQTPDYLLPGDLRFEPRVKWVYDRFGWFVCSWYWIGFRNVGHGITWSQGHPTPKFPQHLTPEELAKYGSEIKQKRIGFIWVMWGFKTVNDRLYTQDRPIAWYWAVPWYSIRLKKRDLGGNHGPTG